MRGLSRRRSLSRPFRREPGVMALEQLEPRSLLDGTLPVVYLMQMDKTASEETENVARFGVKRTGSLAQPLTVYYQVLGGATPDVDYVGLSGVITIPAGKKTRLHLSVAHHADPPGDWKLIVKVDNQPIYETIVGPQTSKEHWLDLNIDLSSYAGKTIDLQLLNQPTDWAYEFGYWGQAEIRSE